MPGADWSKAMVVFADEEDGISVSKDLPRSERHRLRLEAVQVKRAKLIGALEDAGLAAEAEVPAASPSSSILIEASPRALEAVRNAPVVEKVLPLSGEASMQIID
jgi:hypothetical protein